MITLISLIKDFSYQYNYNQLGMSSYLFFKSQIKKNKRKGKVLVMDQDLALT